MHNPSKAILHSRVIRPNDINRPHAIRPNETVGADAHVQISQAKCVGAGLCARPSVRAAAFPCQKYTLYARGRTMDAPLQGDTGGHIGTAPTNLHQTARCAPTSSHCTFDSPRQSQGVFIPHRIAHSIAPNHVVCHYPIGVILSIAQGWQVQRSLPWVMMQARRLPPWGLYFFSSHIITTRGE